MPIIQGDIPEDVLKEVVRRGSKVVIPPQERGGSENAQTMQSTAESMARMTVSDPAPASSSITANTSNTAPVVTDKHTTAANDVLATIGEASPKQPNESKDLQNEEGTKNGVKNKAPAQDQAADLHKPSQQEDANQADSQCSHLTTATTTNGKTPPTEQT